MTEEQKIQQAQTQQAKQVRRMRQAIGEGPLTRAVLITIALVFLGVMLISPLLVVFIEAFSRGIDVYLKALVMPDTQSALQLTLLVAAIAVPANLVFGVAAAWAITKFDFKGKAFLLTLIDLPFAVSPVVSGLVFSRRARRLFTRRVALVALLYRHLVRP